jgi:hypothetical protein
VGTVSGSDALIALVVEDNTVLAYVCGTSSWQTQTGWFYSQINASKTNTVSRILTTGTINPASSASGLKFEGSITPNGANGTVTLKDGTVQSWQAEPAQVGTTAGLYRLEDAGSLVGLIVTNDHKTAGTARLNNGTTSSSIPVVVKALPIQRSQSGIQVGIQPSGLPSLTLTLPPILTPSETVILPSSPTVIVLLHGATTRSPSPLPDKICPASVNPQPNPGVRQHARCYWSSPFINGILNGVVPGKGKQTLFTFNNQDVSDVENINDFETTSLVGDEFTDFISTEKTVGLTPPKLSVLLTYRDASKGLIQQSVAATNQIYASIQKYIARFKVAPKLVFVGHSYGGLVTRFILSNPSLDDLKAAVPLIESPLGSGYNTTNGTRSKMGFLRDRTYYATTMSSPHEGTLASDVLGSPNITIQNVLIRLHNNTANVPDRERLIADGLLAIVQGSANINVNNPITVNDISNAVERVREQYENTVVQEASSAFWRNLNQGPLHPKLAVRSGASIIAGAANQLIPIYVAGGRSPGGQVFDTLDLRQALVDMGTLSERNQNWTLQTMVGDFFFNALGGFGSPTAGFENQFDRRERVGFADEARRLMQVPFINLGFFMKDYFGNVDGALKYIYNYWDIHALITKTVLPIYLEKKWQFDLGGNLTINVPTFKCSYTENNQTVTQQITLDQTTLLSSLASKFGSVKAGLSSIAGKNLDGLLNLLNTNLTTALEMADWLKNKVLGFGAALKGSCVNPANWTLDTVPLNLPAPRLFETNQTASDKEIDNDGLVHYTSAMGFRLGTLTNEFFDHTRNDAMLNNKPIPGSWYRRYTSDLEPYNHNILFFIPGRWVYDNIVGQNPGPIPANAGTISVYP